jgi:L-ascorbate metabolism protein UlaG (beta-lactamase superfamily)
MPWKRNGYMNYTLLRNAAALLTVGGTSFLIDPALDAAGARPPVPNTPNQHPNPLVDLPPGWEDIVASGDALLVTHLHRDHFDDASGAQLDKDLPLYCQPEDVERLAAVGFRNLLPVLDRAVLNGVTITRTAGQHGSGEIGKAMAPVSGFVFDAPHESRVYLAGDTIWCDDVANAIARHRPDIIIVNAGGARFLEGDPIVMTAEDIVRVHIAAPEAMIVVVHLEAINHCLETRGYYRQRLPELGVDMGLIRVPEDGESVIW